MICSASCCQFHYPDWQFGLSDLVRYLLLGKKIKKWAVQSWAFHCRDVFTVFSCVIRERAQDTPVIEKTIHRFSAEFGESSARALTAV